MARTGRPLTAEALHEEIRFLLKTLMRDDLFGEEVSLTEAEKLLEASLSLGFVDYCAFLKRHAYVDIDRARNTVAVLPRGKNVAEGGADPSLLPMLSAHFAKQVVPGAPGDARAAPPVAPVPAAVERRGPAQGGMHVIVAREPTPMTVGHVEVDRYERGETLGQGSLGTVYRARDAVLDRSVVVKEVRHLYELVSYVSRDELTRRVREAVMSQARLDHPHILRVVDVSFAADAPTLVVDHAAGGSLRARMARAPGGQLPVEVCLRALLQMAAALEHAHNRGVVHGSIKPENVLFDVAGNVKVSDFGVARVAERPTEGPATSAPPVYVGRGNPSYMAPEQLHRGETSKRSDLYSVGILFYEMLTGQLPGRRSPMPSATPRLKQELGTAAATVDDIFDRMTRDPPNERFASFAEVLDALCPALPKRELTRGTLLLYETDPLPPPAAEAASAADPAAAEGGFHELSGPIPVTGSSVIVGSEPSSG
ncbi:MAG: serine/threonine protein kinase [Deltaproteobacteria bacterium]|nr:serine/threonine protein kinase [Deltaproteobacteria bacterium]